MTIEADRAWLWFGGLTVLAAVIAYGCAGANKLRHGDTIDVSSYPSDIQVAYKVFAVRCSRCHTLARPLNARIDDPQHWVRYVARMRLNPTSGINAKDAQTILRFLLYYMHQQQQQQREAEAPSEPPPESRTAAPTAASQMPAAATFDAAVPAAPSLDAAPEAAP
jgi:hypothetical protein